MSELTPINPSPVVPTIKKIGREQRQNQHKRKKQAEDDATLVEQTQAHDQPAQHIDEIV